MRRSGRAWLLIASVTIATACTTSRPRPTCSESDPDCGTDWECMESSSLEACVAVIIPYPCTQTRFLCIAQGILTAGEACLGDGECVDGLYCPYSTDGSPRVCTAPECETRADCPDGQACRLHLCRADTADAICGAELECADHQYCAGSCTIAPPEGGNRCDSDIECADGRTCVERAPPYRYCTECDADAECAGHEAGSFCYDAFCAQCSPTSCGDQVCDPARGCVQCIADEDCPTGHACSQSLCRERCDFPNHEECASGHCAVGDLCVLPVGTPCDGPDHSAAECGEGSCVATDAGGAAAEPYCTRTCGFAGTPCPAGYTCVENVDVDGITEDVCLTD